MFEVGERGGGACCPGKANNLQEYFSVSVVAPRATVGTDSGGLWTAAARALLFPHLMGGGGRCCSRLSAISEGFWVLMPSLSPIAAAGGRAQ